jgi:hypothetical protein
MVANSFLVLVRVQEEVSKRELHSGITPLCSMMVVQTIPGSGRVKRLQEVVDEMMTAQQQGN